MGLHSPKCNILSHGHLAFVGNSTLHLYDLCMTWVSSCAGATPYPFSSFFHSHIWQCAVKVSMIGEFLPTLFFSFQTLDAHLRAFIMTLPKFWSPGLHLELWTHQGFWLYYNWVLGIMLGHLDIQHLSWLWSPLLLLLSLALSWVFMTSMS